MSCRSWVVSMWGCPLADITPTNSVLFPERSRCGLHQNRRLTPYLTSSMVFVAVLVVAALILFNALYVAAEFAAVSVRRSRIQQLATDGNSFAAWLLPVLESPASLDRYIAACQIGITLSSLVLGAYAQSTFAVWLTPYFASLAGLQNVAAQTTSTAVVLLVLTIGQVIFAELIPKSLALQH